MKTILITLAFTVGITEIAFAQNSKNFPQTTVSIIIDAPIVSTFNYIVPVDLSHIFKRYNLLPAVTKTDEAEKWFRAGLTRTVYFEDGNTAREKLLTVEPNTSFSYVIDNFTSPFLRFLAKRIEGDWVFTDFGNGRTKIDWTYKFVPQNFIACGLIKIAVLRDIKGLLYNALKILKDDLEREKTKKGNR